MWDDIGPYTPKDTERVEFNMQKALALNAEISYKDTEEGHTIITITKDGKTTTEEFDSISPEVKAGIDKAMTIRRKKLSKDEAKSLVKNRYKIGDILVLRGKIKCGSQKNVKTFEVKKVIWSVRSKAVNVLILKQLTGPDSGMTLDRNDCKRYHIKYEEGLLAYSMMLDFKKLKKK